MLCPLRHGVQRPYTIVAAVSQGTLQRTASLSDLIKAIPVVGSKLTKLLNLDSNSLSAQTFFGVRRHVHRLPAINAIFTCIWMLTLLTVPRGPDLRPNP